MHQSKIVTLLEPVTELGRALADGLAEAYPDIRRRFLHTRDASEHLLVEIAGEAALVAPLQDAEELEGSDVVVVLDAPAPARADTVLAFLRDHPEVALLDCSQPGIAPDETSCAPVAPGASRRWRCLVDPGLLGPLHLLRALRPLAPDTALVTTLTSVGSRGDDAVGELAAQGAARLSGAAPARARHLPSVLAFDLMPARAERTGRLQRQLASLLPELAVHLHVVDAGVFFGYAATVSVHCRTALHDRAVRAALRDAPGLRLARRGESVAPSDLVDHRDAACADVRVEGEWLSAWLAWDGSMLGGGGAALEALAELMA